MRLSTVNSATCRCGRARRWPAPTYVFPDLGRTWIGSTPPSSSRQSRTVAATRSSPARRSLNGDATGSTGDRVVVEPVRLNELHLLLREPGGVAERLLDVFALQVRVAREHLIEGCPVRALADHDRDPNPHAPGARAGSRPPDERVEGDEYVDVLRGGEERLAAHPRALRAAAPALTRYPSR